MKNGEKFGDSIRVSAPEPSKQAHLRGISVAMSRVLGALGVILLIHSMFSMNHCESTLAAHPVLPVLCSHASAPQSGLMSRRRRAHKARLLTL